MASPIIPYVVVDDDGDAAAAAAASTTRTRSKSKQRSSPVFELHFHHRPASAPGEEDKAICRWCRQELSAKAANGTSHLWRHVESKKCRSSYIKEKISIKKCRRDSSAAAVADDEMVGFAQIYEGLDANGLVNI